MTQEAADARKNAVHCEVRKVAYRQTKEGVVISFVMHPDEIPDAVASAALGTRYVMALAKLNDDETAAG